MTNSNIDPEEIEKFERMAEEWWKEEGNFRLLHQFNPIRISYIKDLVSLYHNKPNPEKPLQDISILDVGCGGGLLAEPMCRLGAKVTGIDASTKNIKVAALHAEKMGLEINYQHTRLEEISHQKFDVVLAMEVVEHVPDLEDFISHCASATKKGGLIFIATLNRTLKSFICAILGAEYLLRWLPRGTHSWQKFVKPSEIARSFDLTGIKIQDMAGMKLNPLNKQWRLSRDLDVNYVIVGMKH